MNLNVLGTKDFCSGLLVFVFCDSLNRFVLSCWRQGLLCLSIIAFINTGQRGGSSALAETFVLFL